ncbi:hypothetical protein [Rhizobium arsenicireducens]
MTFKVGNHSGVAKGSMEEGAFEFAEALGKDLADRAQENTSVDVVALQKRLDSRVSRSINEALNFASKTMVGTKSSQSSGDRGSPTQVWFNWDERDLPAVNPNAYRRDEMEGRRGSISWQALHYRTIQKKRYAVKPLSRRSTAEASRHFIHTGKLKTELVSLASNIVQKTGTVKIGYIKTQAKRYNIYRGHASRLKMGKLQLTFLPRMAVRYLPGVKNNDVSDFDPSMLFERSLGISNSSLDKLRGRGETHRPLLQPVFTYWVLNRIPRLVAGTINRTIKGTL